MQHTLRLFSVITVPLGKIKELFSKEAIDDSTVLVLVNAVYFKAKWEKEFDCENTVDAPFSLSEVLTVLGCCF